MPNTHFRRPLHAALASTLSLLSACATQPAPRADTASVGNVEAKELPAASDERYRQGGGVTYALPLPASENPMPNYPASLLPARLAPRTFAARLIFNGQGEVTDVRPLRDDGSAESAAFLASVREACRHWYYTALVERRHMTTDGPDGRKDSIVETPTPFHLDFEFTFSQTRGHGVVQGRATDEGAREAH